ncbi:MAG: hypothetical protein RDV41_03760 [Planctomycetota bacterium]|nr:hypothetical protein [Planctomycetota bacterium]
MRSSALIRALSLASVAALVLFAGCASDTGTTPGRTDAADATTSAYVVVTNIADSDPFYEAVTLLAAHRKAATVLFSPDDLEGLRARLAELSPRFVAVVVKPEVIDTNFIRSFLMMSTRLDADPFCDFSYGYITGATARDAATFVRNIIKAEKDGLPKRFMYSYVCGGQCDIGREPEPDWLCKAGYTTGQMALGLEGDRNATKDFLAQHLRDLEGHGLIKMTGCGDPERVWLFDDDRNRHSEKHWPYDPTKVGQNPGDEMFWIDAAMYRELNLYPAVITSGTCHCGSLRRVYVEGDIVSTFGASDKVEVYDMPAERSLGLVYLASGVTAAMLPVGPNHGWRTDVEVRRMFSTGAPLGEVMRSCYDELVLAFCGEMKYGLYTPDGEEADPEVTAMMRGGAANRVLYGDPAFAPFQKLDVAPIRIAGPTKSDDGSFRIECEVVDPSAPDYVDQYDCRQYWSRVFFAIDLPAELAAKGVRAVEIADCAASRDRSIVGEVRWAEERDRGNVRLHVGAFSTRQAYRDGLGARAGVSLVFRIVPAENEAAACRVGNTRYAATATVPAEPDTEEPTTAKKPPEGKLDPGALAEKVLDTPWAYEWNDRTLANILESIEHIGKAYAEEYGPDLMGLIKFELDEGAKPAAAKRVSLKLESEPLRGGLDRLCKELGLKYELDKTRGVVKFSKAE